MVRCVVLLLLVVAVGGCGGSGDAREEPTTTVELQVEEAGDRPALYYLEGEHLSAVASAEAADAAPQAIVEELVANRDGRLTAIPAGTRVRGVTTRGGEAVVDLSAAFARGGGSSSMQARVAQIVYTLTQWPSVERVTITIDGAEVEAIGGEGVPARALTRADVANALPPIFVDRPLPGTAVTSPLTVRGDASVFEANVSLRLEAADGRALAETFATAAEGAPGRGAFETTLRFEVDEPTDATLVAFEESADDESEQHAVRVPLRLLPSSR